MGEMGHGWRMVVRVRSRGANGSGGCESPTRGVEVCSSLNGCVSLRSTPPGGIHRLFTGDRGRYNSKCPVHPDPEATQAIVSIVHQTIVDDPPCPGNRSALPCGGWFSAAPSQAFGHVVLIEVYNASQARFPSIAPKTPANLFRWPLSQNVFGSPPFLFVVSFLLQ